MSVASSNSRDESGSGFSIVSLLVGSAGFLLALICLAFETAGFLARREAWQGQKYADAKAPNAALKSAISALKFDPDNIQALYLKAAKLKENDPKFWDSADFKNTISRAMVIHPNQASIRRLAGEAAFRRGDFAAASDLLWEAMWINPTPPASPTNFWRMTMIASLNAGRTGEAVAAADRALLMSEKDIYFHPQEKGALLQNLIEVYRKAGETEKAARMESVLGAASNR